MKRRPLHQSDSEVSTESEDDDHGNTSNSGINRAHGSRSPQSKRKGKRGKARGDKSVSFDDEEDEVDEPDNVDDSTANSSYSSHYTRSSASPGSPKPRRKGRLPSRQMPQKPDRPDRESTTKDKGKTVTESSGLNILIVCGIAVVVAFCAILLFTCTNEGINPVDDITNVWVTFRKKFEYLKHEYPSQSPRFWKLIGASVKQVLSNPNPMSPAVILLVAPEGASDTGSCFAHQFVSEINHLYNITKSANYVNSLVLDHKSPAKEKQELDKKILQVLKAASSRGIVIDHLESLSPKSALLFHGYCDGDNAPYKNVAIVLVLHISSSEDQLSDKEVEGILTKLWKEELDQDKIPALLSRMANNIAIVKKEVSHSLESCFSDI